MTSKAAAVAGREDNWRRRRRRQRGSKCVELALFATVLVAVVCTVRADLSLFAAPGGSADFYDQFGEERKLAVS